MQYDDDVFYLFFQKQKIAKLHIYLSEGKYHKMLFTYYKCVCVCLLL